MKTRLRSLLHPVALFRAVAALSPAPAPWPNPRPRPPATLRGVGINGTSGLLILEVYEVPN